MRRLLLLTLVVLLAPAAASAASVLIIYDVTGNDTPTLQSALTSGGHSVTLSSVSESTWSGSSPSPWGFDVVIHLNGETYSSSMPVAGQNELVSYVQGGGGFIHFEWNAYQVGSGGGMAAMEPITLLERSDGDTINFTLYDVATEASHPILANVPSSFALPTAGINEHSARTFSTDPATVLMTDNYGNDAVVIREYMAGRVVGFHHAGNYGGYGPFGDPNMQQLIVDAVNWAAGDCDGDDDGWESTSCGGGDCDDSDWTIYPGATEVCDGADNDCDGSTDDVDLDGDGWSGCTDDCDDSSWSVYPGAAEVCDGLDNDCNGLQDDVDDDGDGWDGCGSDCDDDDWSIYPGATEDCDWTDSDCDGDLVDGFPDSDFDGEPDCVDPPGDDDDAVDDDDAGDDDDVQPDDDDVQPDDDDAGDDDDADDDDDSVSDDDDGGGGGGGRSSRGRRGACAVVPGGGGAGLVLLALLGVVVVRRRG